MNPLPTLLLADDHEIVLHGLRALLGIRFHIVGEARDGRTLVEMTLERTPDIVVSDISLPHLNGLDALRDVRAKGSASIWIMLSMHADPSYIVRAFKTGALGYVVKTSAGDELLTAIEAARQGHSYISPSAQSDSLKALLEPGSTRGKVPPHVTPRQTEVLRLLVKGLSAKEIGAQLNISTRTAEAHKYQMMEVLGFKTTAQLIHYAIKNGLV